MGKDLKGKELGQGLSQKANGVYAARITLANGTRRQKDFKTIKEAREWLNDKKFYKDHHKFEDSTSITVDEFFRVWMNMKEQNVKTNTQANYRNAYNWHVKDMLGNMKMSKVTSMDCQNILNDMAKDGYADRTIKDTRSLLVNLFEYAVSQRIVEFNPINKFITVKGRKTEKVKALTPEEEKLVFEKCSNYHKPYYELILQTGLRNGECVGLKWKHVDFENRVINVVEQIQYDKTKKEYYTSSVKTSAGERAIPMTDRVYEILTEKYQNRKSDYVFEPTKKQLDSGIEHISDNMLRCSLRYIAKYNKFDFPLGPHVLRHTFATRCSQMNVSPKVIQYIMGHDDFGTTMNTYINVQEKEVKDEFQKYNDAIKNKVG